VSAGKAAIEKAIADAVRVKPRPRPNGTAVSTVPSIAALKLPRLSDLQGREIPAKVALFDEVLYPGAYLVVGRPKIGKSWMLLQLTMAVADRAAWLGYACLAESEVLAIFAEDDDGRIKGRLSHMGYSNLPTTVHLMNQQTFIAKAQEFAKHYSFAEFIEGYIDANPAIRVVIVDTEVTCRQIWAGERGAEAEGLRIVETDYQQTRTFDELALRRRILILLTNHAKKASGEQTDIHEIINRSNTALAGCSGSIVLADMPGADPLNTENKDRVLGLRGRDLRDDIVLAVRQRPEDACFESLGTYQAVAQTQSEEEILEALEELCQELAPDAYVTTDELAKHVGRKAPTIKRALSRMMKKPDRRFWRTYRISAKPGRKGGLRLDPK